MARTPSTLPGGPRLSDYLSLGVIAQVFPMPAVLTALEQSKSTSTRRRRLPAEVMMYYVLTLCLFRSVSTREVLRCLMDGFRLIRPDSPLLVSGKSSISRVRTQLGVDPFHKLRQSSVHWLSNENIPGAWYCGRRLVAIDGSTLSLPDEKRNRAFFGLPGCSRGQTAFPKMRISMLGVGHACTLFLVFGPLQGIGADTGKRAAIKYRPRHAYACRSGLYGLSLVVTGKKDGCRLALAGTQSTAFSCKGGT